MTPPGPIICLGAAHWDVLARAATAPAAGGDVPGRIVRRPGGVALNVAVALAARGAASTLVAAIGRDREGERLVAAIAAVGVETRHLLRHERPTDCYLAIEGPDGSLHAAVADCTGLEAAGLALLAPLGPALAGAAGLVVDGNLPAEVLAAIGAAVPTPLPVALVPASPAKAERLRPALRLPAVTLYANLAEAAALLGTCPASAAEAARELADAGIATALITDGAREAAWIRSGHTVLRRPPTVALRSVTGAGDVLVAAHLYARAIGRDDAAALDDALAAAAAHLARELP